MVRFATYCLSAALSDQVGEDLVAQAEDDSVGVDLVTLSLLEQDGQVRVRAGIIVDPIVTVSTVRRYCEVSAYCRVSRVAMTVEIRGAVGGDSESVMGAR